MREVTVSRVVDVSPAELSAWLEPAAIVEAEGSFSVETVDDGDDATIVVASGPGIQLPLRFEDREDEIYYTQAGEHGPFSEMETWLETEPVDAGRTRVTIRSAVELAAPLPFGDRIAAWKRNGELEGIIETIETELG
ncbi:SRPBCC family protein [Natrinema sp. SYSU A 869]|uniref:SRPBCC family protein n=1 Tax=Natrinema sp. SYSU A 869 TaxID=2871694 RepID=UPI001CA403D2|nr:SRPBCC family protein [Natrinema sp. SYSU A 869]